MKPGDLVRVMQNIGYHTQVRQSPGGRIVEDLGRDDRQFLLVLEAELGPEWLLGDPAVYLRVLLPSGKTGWINRCFVEDVL